LIEFNARVLSTLEFVLMLKPVLIIIFHVRKYISNLMDLLCPGTNRLKRFAAKDY